MNIIINGGTRGIGKEVVIFLAQNPGNKIIATGRNQVALNDLVNRFSNVKAMKLDIAKINDYAEEFLNAASKEFEKVDILINIAGMMIPKEFMKVKAEDARLMMETNFFGPAFIIRILHPLMHAGSHILNISSMGGFQGASKYKGLSYYSASKAALVCLTECLAIELKMEGISVNCLALGSVQTEMFEEAFPGFKAPVSAKEMGEFISEFALKGHKLFNGKILPVAVSNP